MRMEVEEPSKAEKREHSSIMGERSRRGLEVLNEVGNGRAG